MPPPILLQEFGTEGGSRLFTGKAASTYSASSRSLHIPISHHITSNIPAFILTPTETRSQSLPGFQQRSQLSHCAFPPMESSVRGISDDDRTPQRTRRGRGDGQVDEWPAIELSHRFKRHEDAGAGLGAPLGPPSRAEEFKRRISMYPPSSDEEEQDLEDPGQEAENPTHNNSVDSHQDTVLAADNLDSNSAGPTRRILRQPRPIRKVHFSDEETPHLPSRPSKKRYKGPQMSPDTCPPLPPSTTASSFVSDRDQLTREHVPPGARFHFPNFFEMAHSKQLRIINAQLIEGKYGVESPTPCAHCVKAGKSCRIYHPEMYGWELPRLRPRGCHVGEEGMGEGDENEEDGEAM
ncbi:hypothetical protein P154DRAFT_537868 [Amniculicola lignicola CBS 123094]|uniref:Uncharacterized protein n=1 Tax=Amniculicola lignicola CBS 123094 TaxID=1392246 RepID=A0A6A5W443_9PLEO|nr:hypothetical protein P154DRAFT_537868 [Amniculicola lignicola CBS 123094]